MHKARFSSIPQSWAAMWLLLYFALASGCGRSAEERVGKRIAYEAPPLPTPDELGSPRNDDGSYTVARYQNLELRHDPARWSPHMAAGQCMRWLMECREPPQRTLDDCFASVTACPDDPVIERPPASCCPDECYAEYSQLRKRGTAEMAAIRAVTPGCFDRAWTTAGDAP